MNGEKGKGVVQGNTVVIKDGDIREYDRAEVVVTLLDNPLTKVKKMPVDWDCFAMSSERGKDGYDNDKKIVSSVITME